MGNNNPMMKKTFKIRDLPVILLSSLLFSLGYNLFLNPFNIVPGGATGIAMAANRLFPGISVGSYILLLNLPLILIALKMFGLPFILRSAVGTVFSSIFLDAFSFLPSAVDDPLLAALFGGGAIGISLGLLYRIGYNTGGTDLLVFILKSKFPTLSTGAVLMLTDTAILLSTVLILNNFAVVFISVITIITESRLIDRISAGPKGGQLVFVFTNNYQKMAACISETLSRGVTLVNSTGWYTGKDGRVLLCAVRTREVYRLKAVIKQTDPEAFAVFADAGGISGNGFDLL